MVGQALDGHRNHSTCRVIGPGATDLFCLEGIVLGTVAIDDFDIAAALFGPEAVSESAAAGEQAGEKQVGRNTHVNLRFKG